MTYPRVTVELRTKDNSGQTIGKLIVAGSNFQVEHAEFFPMDARMTVIDEDGQPREVEIGDEPVAWARRLPLELDDGRLVAVITRDDEQPAVRLTD